MCLTFRLGVAPLPVKHWRSNVGPSISRPACVQKLQSFYFTPRTVT